MPSSKKEILFLYTNAFPCDKYLEHYLEHEIPVLAKEFKQIIIFPSDFGAIEIPVPENVEVVNIYSPTLFSMSFPRLLVALPYLIKVFIIELTNTRTSKLYWLQNLKKTITQLYNAFECANATTKFIKERKYNADNICFYSYWLYHSSLFLAILKDKKQIPSFISRGHQADVYEEPHLHKTFFKYFKLKHISRFYLISEHAKNYLINAYPKFTSKFYVAYLGVKDNGLNPPKNNLPFTIVSCSKSSPHKRVHLIPEILKNISFKIEWIHLGHIPNETLEKYIDVLKTNPNISYQFPGDVANPKILEFYETTHVDVFINVSSVEGLSVALMEACSFGITLIATDINGTAEIVNSKSGYLLPLDFDVTKVADIITNIQQNSSFEKRVEARQLFLDRFDADKNFKHFITDIKSI